MHFAENFFQVKTFRFAPCWSPYVVASSPFAARELTEQWNNHQKGAKAG